MHPAAGRRWWQRALACCLALWFVAVATELPVAHACAMHDAAPAAVGHALAGHTLAGHAAVGYAAVRHAAHGAPHAPDHPQRGGACTCLGHCCGSPSVLPPASAEAWAVHTDAAPAPAPGRPHHEYVAAWADFVLPFSTAPPRATLA